MPFLPSHNRNAHNGSKATALSWLLRHHLQQKVPKALFSSCCRGIPFQDAKRTIFQSVRCFNQFPSLSTCVGSKNAYRIEIYPNQSLSLKAPRKDQILQEYEAQAIQDVPRNNLEFYKIERWCLWIETPAYILSFLTVLLMYLQICFIKYTLEQLFVERRTAYFIKKQVRRMPCVYKEMALDSTESLKHPKSLNFAKFMFCCRFRLLDETIKVTIQTIQQSPYTFLIMRHWKSWPGMKKSSGNIWLTPRGAGCQTVFGAAKPPDGTTVFVYCCIQISEPISPKSTNVLHASFFEDKCRNYQNASSWVFKLLPQLIVDSENVHSNLWISWLPKTGLASAGPMGTGLEMDWAAPQGWPR